MSASRDMLGELSELSYKFHYIRLKSLNSSILIRVI